VTPHSTNLKKYSFARCVSLAAISAVILKFAAFCLFGSAASAEPFSFRGVPLGTTLADFRKIPFPDAKYPNTRVLCSGDKELLKLLDVERPPLSSDLTRIGVTACNFYSPSNGRLFRNAPDFANVGGYETTFYFSPASFQEPLRLRLYLISVTPASRHHQTIVDALTSKYGKPTDSSIAKIKNRMGAEFDDETTVWTADGSTILVRKYNGDINQSLITYSLDAIIDATNSAIKSIAIENAKKL
jgi:hypothetical protein